MSDKESVDGVGQKEKDYGESPIRPRTAVISPSRESLKKIESFINSRKWFTDSNTTDNDIHNLIGEDWDEEWETFMELIEQKGFELFEARRKEGFCATIYVNFDKYPNPTPEVHISAKAEQFFSQLADEDTRETVEWKNQIEMLMDELKTIALILKSSTVKLGVNHGNLRVDFLGDPYAFKRLKVIEQLRDETGLEIKM